VDATERLATLEAASTDEQMLLPTITSVLSDTARPRTPAQFKVEQVLQIFALACEAPSASERSISHWTPQALADEAIKRGIVEHISPRSIGRSLKGSQFTTPPQSVLAQR
jgi:hypothetical protein